MPAVTAGAAAAALLAVGSRWGGGEGGRGSGGCGGAVGALAAAVMCCRRGVCRCLCRHRHLWVCAKVPGQHNIVLLLLLPVLMLHLNAFWRSSSSSCCRWCSRLWVR